MAWLILFVAGLFEVGWAVGMKYTDHFTRPLPTIAVVIAMIASVALLEYAARTLPLGTAYAVWTGIGAIGTVLFGILLFGEPSSVARMVCLALIVIGIVGLHVIPAR